MINESEVLIIMFNKSHKKWEDCTKNIEWKKEISTNGIITGYYIKFFNNNEIYRKSKNDFLYYDNPQNVSLEKKFLYIKGKPENNAKQLIKFDSFYKLFYFNGTSKLFYKSDVSIQNDECNSFNGKKILNYLTEIASCIEKNEDLEYIKNQLVDLPIPQESILGKMLNNNLNEIQCDDFFILPFSTNISQKLAIKNSFKYDLSTIQGPPGTGKTQTILNIIANCLYKNQTVAVVSGTNMATQNVYDKLINAGYGSINAYLGNAENKYKFFYNIPKNDFIVSDIKNSNILTLKEKIKELTNSYETCMNAIVESAKISQQLVDLSAEQKIVANELVYDKENISPALFTKRYHSKQILDISIILESILSSNKLSLINKAKLISQTKTLNIKKILNNSLDNINYLKNAYYTHKAIELTEQKHKYDVLISCNDADKLAKDLCKLSKELLDLTLIDKYKSKSQPYFNIQTYKDNFNNFTNYFPVIYSTTHSIRECSSRSFLYDCLIIDESSMVDLCSAAIALSCAKRVVIIGDEKQLPNVIKNQIRNSLNTILKKYNLPDYFSYSNNLLSFINKAFPCTPNTMLNEHIIGVILK